MKLIALSIFILPFSSAFCQSLPVTWKTHSAVKLGYYKASAKYAIFGGSSKLISYANSELAAEAKRAVNKFKTECAGMDKPRNAYEFDMQNQVVFSNSTLISTLTQVFWYTGGAHPNTDYTTQNFAIVAGVAKRVGLNDLLKPGIRPSQIDDLLIAKLRDLGAQEAVDNNIPFFSPPQRDRFTINQKGLNYIFPPYDVGYYAQGTFRVLLNWNELSPFVKMDGILKPFAK